MSDAHRKTGGDNNKKGSSYEDAFAVYRIIELSPRVILENIPVTVREQAGCPVDDFVFREIDRHHYYQLKNDLEITWGMRGHKLKREYIAQKADCDARKEDHTLTVVVSHAHRKESLDGAMPTELKGAVRVLHFPEVRRPSELAIRGELR